jgi:hypothetical protein
VALEYRLTVAGDTPVNLIAERAFPLATERPTGIAPRLAADHKKTYGFDVTIAAGRDGYFDLEADDGSWEWEPESYVRIEFRLDKQADARWMVTNMLTVIRRVLDTGTEDATFDFNGDLLLFARRDGELTKHHRGTWWERYSPGNQLIPE